MKSKWLVLLLAGTVWADDLSMLKKIPPLPKPTVWYEGTAYSCWSKCSPEYMAELTRICGFACVRLENADPNDWKKASATHQPICVNVSPSLARADVLEGQLKAFLLNVSDPTVIKRVLIDFEEARLTSADPRLQKLSDLLRKYLPSAVQEWYQCDQREIIHQSWVIREYGARYLIPATPSSCTLYSINDRTLTFNKLKTNVDAATARGQPLTPIVGMGWSYDLTWDISRSVPWTKDADAIYSPGINYYMTGAWLYDQWNLPPDFPGNKNIGCVAMYPGPGRTEDWAKYWTRNFIQFACGGTRTTPDREYTFDPGWPDLNGDGIIDMNDFGLFQRTGHGAYLPQ